MYYMILIITENETLFYNDHDPRSIHLPKTYNELIKLREEEGGQKKDFHDRCDELIKKGCILCMMFFMTICNAAFASPEIKRSNNDMIKRIQITALSRDAFEFIEPFEGFSRCSFSDHRAVSIGYGTRAKSKKECIDKAT
jgi:hypothetical protein